VEQGRDPASFASDLEVRARELLVVATLDEVPAEMSLTPEADKALRAQAARTDGGGLVRLLELLGEAREAVRAGADARTRLELALVKAAKPELDSRARALLARIERLERERGATPAVARSAPAQPAPTPDPPAAMPAPERTSGQVGDPAAEAPGEERPTPAAGGTEIDSLRAAWPTVVDIVRAENALLGALIEEAEPAAVAGEQLTVAFAASAPFLKKKAEDPANRAAVAAALSRVVGGHWSLSYALGREEGQPGPRRRAGSEEEWVTRLMEEFDAEELPGELAAAPGEGRGLAERSAAPAHREEGG
jgi:DNA polymerase-3 subunit gamma/tau